MKAKNNIIKISLMVLLLGFISVSGVVYNKYVAAEDEEINPVIDEYISNLNEFISDIIDNFNRTNTQGLKMDDFDLESFIMPLIKESLKQKEDAFSDLDSRIKLMEDLKLNILKQLEESYSTAGVRSFFIDVSPENPGPNTKVDVSLKSYSFDINRSDITWVLNGRTELSGAGEKYFSFTTGAIGSKSSLSIIVISQEGNRLVKTLNFYLADADILWEAETYVPEGYRGKALASSESLIKITAFPNFLSNGVQISPSRLVYEWEINYKNIPSVSGYGKQSFSYTSPKINQSDTIKVTISNYNRSMVAEETIEIAPVSPKILFYQDHPLEGKLYNHALVFLYDTSEKEINIIAEPYFFSKIKLQALSYKWTVNNTDFEPEDKDNKIKIKLGPESLLMTSIINVNIRNNSNILQFGEKTIQINFNVKQ